MQYYVGEDDDRHMVDHPPLFACECEGRKTLLTLNQSFIEELLATAQDIMPGNPGEIAGIYFKPAEMTFTLHSFLIPPKIILYNPDQLRGPEALPYTVVLVDKKFFGIPAAYLTPDRFAGCESLKDMKVRPRRPLQQRPRPQSGVKQSGSRRAPQQPAAGQQPRRRPQGKPQPGKAPPKGAPRGRPAAQRPDQSRRRRPDESGSRGGAPGPRPRPR